MEAFIRRTFLARASMFGTVVGSGAFLPGAVGVAPAANAYGSVVLDAFSAFSLDTMRGLCFMSMPGPDEWSRQQGTPRTDPGPIEVGGGEFVMDLFDNYLGMGDQLAHAGRLGAR